MVFVDFEKTYGDAKTYQSVDDEVISKYAGILPEVLIEKWKMDGFCSYNDGLIWIVDPRYFEDIISEWITFESDADMPVVFMRTAFGHVYFWSEGYVYSLETQMGSLSKISKDVSKIFRFLCEDEFQQKILRKPLFDECLKRLGPVTHEECYGFEPALILGGLGDVDSVKKVRIREYLGILAQLVIG